MPFQQGVAERGEVIRRDPFKRRQAIIGVIRRGLPDMLEQLELDGIRMDKRLQKNQGAWRIGPSDWPYSQIAGMGEKRLNIRNQSLEFVRHLNLCQVLAPYRYARSICIKEPKHP
jgi:hypothetical protein